MLEKEGLPFHLYLNMDPPNGTSFPFEIFFLYLLKTSSSSELAEQSTYAPILVDDLDIL